MLLIVRQAREEPSDVMLRAVAGGEKSVAAALSPWHHLGVLAKWFRLGCWVRAVIVFPGFAGLVFVVDVVTHVRPIFPGVVTLPLVVTLVVCLPHGRRDQEGSAGSEKQDPGA